MVQRLVLHGHTETGLAQSIGLNPHSMVTGFHPIYDQFPAPRESRESIRRSLELGKRVLLFFGFIRQYKGLDCLLEAFCAIAPKYPDVSLLVVGEHFHGQKNNRHADERFLKHLAPDDPVRSQIVRIDRYVANEEVGRYFTVADALVAPYLSVSQSGPLQVAYAFDKPVIASDLPAFRECVGHGESGYLFAAGDARDLAEKIKLFLAKPITAAQVRRFRERFGWDRYIDLLLGSDNGRSR
jgi:glycosyltransferase involved in cell wall biosynthesis